MVERELPDAEVVIPQPFWPAYLTAERIAKAKKLKLAVNGWHRLRSQLSLAPRARFGFARVAAERLPRWRSSCLEGCALCREEHQIYRSVTKAGLDASGKHLFRGRPF